MTPVLLPRPWSPTQPAQLHEATGKITQRLQRLLDALQSHSSGVRERAEKVELIAVRPARSWLSGASNAGAHAVAFVAKSDTGRITLISKGDQL
jgi:hypothetical protein